MLIDIFLNRLVMGGKDCGWFLHTKKMVFQKNYLPKAPRPSVLSTLWGLPAKFSVLSFICSLNFQESGRCVSTQGRSVLVTMIQRRYWDPREEQQRGSGIWRLYHMMNN